MKTNRLALDSQFCLLRPFLTLLSCFLLSISTAQTLTLDRTPETSIDLTKYTKIYVDKTAQLRLQEIEAHWHNEQFISLQNLVLDSKFKRGQYGYWLHLNIQNQHPTDTIKGYFHTGINDTINVYQFNQNKLLQYFQMGKKIRPNTRIEKGLAVQSNNLVPIVIAPDAQYEYFFRLRQRLGVEGGIQPKLYSIDAIPSVKWQGLSIYYLWQGIFFGILFFVFAFSLLQFLQNKDRTLLFYALYAFSIIPFYIRHLWINDILLKNWTFHVLSLHEFHLPFSIGIYLFYFLFVGSFLNSEEKYPWLYQFIRISIGIMLSFFLIEQILVRVDLDLAWQISYYYRILFSVAALFFLIRLWLIKDRLARIIVIGTTFLSLITVANMLYSLLSSQHWYEWWDVTMLGLQIGIIVELLFFSAALGYRSKLIIAQKQRAELDLQRKETENENLQKLEQFKSKLYTNLTHEFRTPLTVIKGLTEELQGKQRYKQDERKLQVIQQNSYRILNLVNQMLELAKLESGKHSIQYTQIDIILLLNYLTDSFQSLAQQKKIMLSFHSSMNGFWMDSDQEKLQRIISNLVINALKFTEEHGRIKLTAERMEQYLEIKVKDSGQGIAAADLPHIFDRFYQVEKKDYEGTGIGLALVKELIALLEGSIKVESELKRGTTFTIQFPIRNQAKKEVAQKKEIVATNTYKSSFQTTSLPQQGQSKILIIEDNWEIVQYLFTLLAPKYQIEVAKNGVLGLEKVKSWQPHLILCDIMMPKMDGYEVCEQLKANKQTAAIPIILLTAKATQTEKNKGLQLGADAYLKKPFDREELQLTIENLLKQKSIPHPPFDKSEHPFLEQFKKVVQIHLNNENLNVALLCQQLHISKTQLHRQTKKAVDMTPMQYVRLLRLQQAYYWLQTTDKSVKEIAFDCGFTSVSAFSQGFKEVFGTTASEVT
ncbi:MAG: ATP-binding protein [Bacteroidota bacterium]